MTVMALKYLLHPFQLALSCTGQTNIRFITTNQYIIARPFMGRSVVAASSAVTWFGRAMCAPHFQLWIICPQNHEFRRSAYCRNAIKT